MEIPLHLDFLTSYDSCWFCMYLSRIFPRFVSTANINFHAHSTFPCFGFEVRSDYIAWHRNRTTNDFRLGAVQFVEVTQDRVIANMIGQHHIKSQNHVKPIRYPAIQEALLTVGEYARANSCDQSYNFLTRLMTLESKLYLKMNFKILIRQLFGDSKFVFIMKIV